MRITRHALLGALLALATVGMQPAVAQDDTPSLEFLEAHPNHPVPLIDSLLARETPRAMILAVSMLSSSNVRPNVSRGDLLERAIELAPDDKFVQWGAALYGESAAARSKPVQTLLRLEPDNGAVWIFMLQVASEAHDEAAVNAALLRIGEAAEFNDHFRDFMMAWVDEFRAIPQTSEPARSPEQVRKEHPLFKAFAKSYLFSGPALSSLKYACVVNGEPLQPDRRKACVAAGRLIAFRATSSYSRSMSISMLRNNGSPDFTMLERNFNYLWESSKVLAKKLICDPDGIQLYISDWLEARNDLEATERMLLRAGLPLLPPPDWEPGTNNGYSRGCD